MTTHSKLTEQDRADAIALGGAYAQAIKDLRALPTYNSDPFVLTERKHLAEILHDALQHRRTIEDLKAQHARDLEALAGDYCQKCSHRNDRHWGGTDVGGGYCIESFCGCFRADLREKHKCEQSDPQSDLKAQHDREIAEYRRRADTDARRIKALEARVESLNMAQQGVRIA